MRLIEPSVLRERFAEHSLFAERYVAKINEVHGTQVTVNDGALFLAIKSAYDDIERYKLYHLDDPHEKKSNAVKRVAYLTKWIVKTRPLHSPTPQNMTDEKPLLINAAFCLFLARIHISAELSVEFVFSKNKEYEMVYDLTFRELNGDALLSMFQNFYDVARGESLLEDLSEYKYV